MKKKEKNTLSHIHTDTKMSSLLYIHIHSAQSSKVRLTETIMPQTLILKQVQVNIVDAVTGHAATDPETKEVFIQAPFISPHSLTTNFLTDRLPILLNTNSVNGCTLQNLDLEIELTQTMPIEFTTSIIKKKFHTEGHEFERYTGYIDHNNANQNREMTVTLVLQYYR